MIYGKIEFETGLISYSASFENHAFAVELYKISRYYVIFTVKSW